MSQPIDSLASARAMFARMQTEAGERGLSLREPPPPPIDCCGRGCEGCVWLDWYAAVARWQREAEARLAG